MYLRTTKRHNKDGSTVEYYQLAETRWDPTQRRPPPTSSTTLAARHLDRAALLRSPRASVVCQGGIDIPSRGEPRRGPSTSSGSTTGGRPCGPRENRALASLCGAWTRPLSRPMRWRSSRWWRTAWPSPVHVGLLCVLRWRERAYLPEAAALTLDHLYFALDFLDTIESSRSSSHCWISSRLMWTSSFWDMTSVYFEVDDEDTECETKRDMTLPPLRKRATTKQGRGNQPQVVVVSPDA